MQNPSLRPPAFFLVEYSRYCLQCFAKRTVPTAGSLLFAIVCCLPLQGQVKPPAGIASNWTVKDIPKLGPDVPTTPLIVEPEIQYIWELGKYTEFNFRIEAGSRDSKELISGSAKFIPTSSRSRKLSSENNHASGSGFVVHPDGIIVTCEHVVRGATKISVKLGETDYVAKAILLDCEHDLAILRIDASNLQPLAIANSGNVQLAQEVRVIGFPLSDLLGESIKVTRGEISGIDRDKLDSAFQIDVTVNAGNSGGPMLDQTGQVVGVASQLLSGEGIAAVGFAVESIHLANALRSVHVQFASVVETQPLVATQLVANAAKSVCFIKVERDAENGIGYDRPQVLDFEGRINQSITLPPGLYGKEESPKVTVDRTGQILNIESELSLPFLLGHVCEIGLEHIPARPNGSVSSKRPVVFQRVVQRDPMAALGFGGLRTISPRFRSPRLRGSEPEVTILQGIESVTGKFGARKGDAIGFEKSYSLEFASAKSKDEPEFKLIGNGVGEFDIAKGQMTDMVFTGELTSAAKDNRGSIPVKLTYKRMSDAEMKERDAQVKVLVDQIMAKQAEKAKALIKPDPTSTKLDLFDPNR